MKRNFLIMACALTIGTCLTVESVDAQSNSRQSNTPAKGNSTYGKSQGSAMGNSSDQMFIQKAMEADKAEIELGKMALQKASSEKVKEFAQMMIDEHTANSSQLAAIISGMGAGNASERMGTGNTNSGSSNTGSSMSSTGSTIGSGSLDTNTGTSGTSSSASTSGSGNTNTGSTTMSSGSGGGSTSGTGSGTVGNTSGAGTSGTNTGTSTSGTSSTSGMSGNNNSTSGNTSSNTDVTTNNPSSGMGNTSGMGATGSRVGQTASDMGNPGTSGMLGEVALSPEHRALSDRLAAMTGAQFDREYIMAQIKDHDKTIALYENQAKNGKDAQMKAFAQTMLPNIRKHRQMAMDMSTNMGSGSKTGGMNHNH